MTADANMQREALPRTVAGIRLSPLTLPRVNAASAMRCTAFNLDDQQRAEISESRTYRGIIRDIIVIFYLCAHTETESDLAMWEPFTAISRANAWAAKNQISETSPNFAEYQLGMWELVNPLFENDAVPVLSKGETELGRAKKKSTEG